MGILKCISARRRMPPGGCNCTPAYATGDRTANIAATAAGGLINNGTVSNLVDGGLGSNATDAVSLTSQSVSSSLWIKFDFGSGNSFKITEVTFRHEAGNQGTWKWQGSNDDASWTDIGSNVTLGSAGTSETYDLSGNTAGYRYYRVVGVSGSTNAGIWNQEFEFKQCDCNA